MARTPSNMIELGTRAPDFALPDTVSGKTITFADAAGPQGTVVMFICNHCPYVKLMEADLARFGSECQQQGVGVVAISANDAENYPEDSPTAMQQNAQRLGYTFPYLYDETQQTARAYKAACTPDFYLFDAGQRCVYRGQYDDARPGNGKPVSGRDLRAAVAALVSGQPPLDRQQPSLGCNIKWKD